MWSLNVDCLHKLIRENWYQSIQCVSHACQWSLIDISCPLITTSACNHHTSRKPSSIHTEQDPPVEILDVGFDDHSKLWTSQASTRWPRVKPSELDQTNGDFSTIVPQLNTPWSSGYIMRVHDIIATRHYRYWLVPLLLSDDTILTWYDDMVQNIPTPPPANPSEKIIAPKRKTTK